MGDPAWRLYWSRLTRRWHDTTGAEIPTEGIAINAYAHLVDHSRIFIDAALRHDKTIHLTEINTLDHPPGAARASWLDRHLSILEAHGVNTAEIFIIGGHSYGAWDERYILTDDECAHLGELWRDQQQ